MHSLEKFGMLPLMTKEKIDTSKSLEQLDGENWGTPAYPSHLVTTCHKLRKIPLSEFDAENFRILIGQNISLKYLIPLVLDLLESDPWIEGDFFPGDLLGVVLRADKKHWEENREQRDRLANIVVRARELAESSLDEDGFPKVNSVAMKEFERSLAQFDEHHPKA